MPRLYLASQSPRRLELLAQIGVPVTVMAADIDEAIHLNETAEHYVKRLALEKARVIQTRLQDPEAFVLGADTSVVLDGVILGKPSDHAESIKMLSALSGRTHHVLTAVALVGHAVANVICVSCEVRFRRLTAAEIEAYWHTGEPCDKAGSYGIQGLGAVFVESIRGSYSAVVGLPLCETSALLAEQGIGVWQKG